MSSLLGAAETEPRILAPVRELTGGAEDPRGAARGDVAFTTRL